MAKKPTRLTLCLNALAGGYHDLLVQASAGFGETDLVEHKKFEPHDVSGAVRFTIAQMEQHKITMVDVKDPGRKLLTTANESKLMLRALRALAAAPSTR